MAKALESRSDRIDSLVSKSGGKSADFQYLNLKALTRDAPYNKWVTDMPINSLSSLPVVYASRCARKPDRRDQLIALG
jgi:hypothetical protein